MTDKERYLPLCCTCLNDFCWDEYNHGFEDDGSYKSGIAYTVSEDGQTEYQVYVSLTDLRVWREEISDEGCAVGFDVSFSTYEAMYDWLTGNLDFCWLVYSLTGKATYD